MLTICPTAQMKKNRDSSGSCAPAQEAGMALALPGVVFVVLKGNLIHLSALRQTPGDGWILVAAVSWVVTNPSVPTGRALGLAVLAGAGLVMFLSPLCAALIARPALGDLQQWFHLVGAAFILPSNFAASGSPARRNLPSGEPASGAPRNPATRLG
jgi:drug/metabolite transporter (DMT)-like permease